MSTFKFLGSGSGNSSSIIRSRVTSTSTLGAGDVDLSTGLKRGGGTATDDSSGLNTAVNGASEAYPVLMEFDAAHLSKTIIIPTGGCVTIKGNGPSTGMYMKHGSNGPAIHNGTVASEPYDPYLQSTSAPTNPTGYVHLENFYVNGNAGDGTTGNATAGQGYQIPLNAAGTGTVPDCFISGIDLRNLYSVDLINMTLYDIPCFSILLMNVKKFNITGLRVLRKNNRPINTDGPHFDGGFEDGTLSDFYIESGDDAIAVNVAEGYANPAGRLTISNGIVRDCFSMIRVYSTSGYPGATIKGIKISNVVADTFKLGFQLGFGSAGGTYAGPTGACDSFVANNIKIATPLLGDISNNHKYLELKGIEWEVGNFSNYDTSSGFGGYAFLFEACVVDVFKISGFKAYYPGNYVPGFFAFGSPQTFNTTPGNTVTVTPHINHLIIEDFDASNVSSIIYGQAASAISNYVDLVSGSGVLGTGWQFPDSIMANNCYYISATGSNAGKVCIKKSGTVNVIA